MNIQQQQAQISHLAILAAILFNIDKAEAIKVKPDDSSEEVEMFVQSVGIEQEGEALVCVIPLEKIVKYACMPYTFKFAVDNGHAIISFEKQEQTSGLLTATGQQVATQSATINNLLRKLTLGSEKANES